MKLVAENLSYAYDGGEALWSNVSFEVNPGDIFSIMGANGCGKSTLIRCLIGFLKPHTGSVRLVEDDGTTYDVLTNPNEFTQNIGYVPQMQNTANIFSVRDYVVMGRAPHMGLFRKPSEKDYALTDEILKEMHIYELKDRFFNTLSGGQQRQAVIARAIVQEPKIVILDEPANHLDYGNQYRVVEMIQKLAERGIAVILTTHAPDHALHFNKTVGIMIKHKFIVGKADEVITEKLLMDLYNMHVRIIELPEMNRKICVAEHSRKEGCCL
ncbi:MAG: ABC transporter ATP-binding protein [Phascolarctobacterium sp.]|nr:ABC transporter ATP-binding protein [Phascolarctobacterium sp.]